MKRLGAYISPRADTASSSPYFTKGCFVYYEYDSHPGSDWYIYKVKIWRLDADFNQQPDEVIFLKSPSELKEHIEPHETLSNHYISYNDQTYRIRDMKFRFTRFPDIEVIDELTVESIDARETLRHDDSSAYRFLKEAKLTDNIYQPSYRMYGSFTTTHPDTDKVLAMAEAFKMWKNKNKETETMEKKKMTQTDSFLKDLNGITITSTYSKLDHGFGKPYYIYYPKMEEITDDIADTLLTVLLMAKRDYIHKVVFNPRKGTTTISKSTSNSVTVRCKDGEFDYILGYEMARTKMYLGSDDYNWFNKIKNHRKTHIEITANPSIFGNEPTEPKAKRTSKKGGKK